MLFRSLKIFLTDRISRNKENLELKARENLAFESVLCVLNDVDIPQSLAWDYHWITIRNLLVLAISCTARRFMIIRFYSTKKEKLESKVEL